ncbi:hypothetical protein D3C81_1587800 [compost metagenome]
MAKEIERKFLVLFDDYLKDATKVETLMQSYVNGIEGVHISIFASQDTGYVEIDTERDAWAIAINSEDAAEIAKQDVDALTVRLRSVDDATAFLTIKGRSSDDGLERDEWEYPISIELYNNICSTLELEDLRKFRYYCPLDSLVIEVDVFESEEGVKPQELAEIEFPVGYDHSQILWLPGWVGEEVTGNVEYYNSVMIKSGKIKTGKFSPQTKN